LGIYVLALEVKDNNYGLNSTASTENIFPYTTLFMLSSLAYSSLWLVLT